MYDGHSDPVDGILTCRMPDGRRVAMQVCEGFSCKLFALELGRGVLTPVARDPGRFFGPAWSPDGRRIAFSRLFQTNPKLGLKASDGSGEIAALTEGNPQDPEFTRGFGKAGLGFLYPISGAPVDLFVQGTGMAYRMNRYGPTRTLYDVAWTGGLRFRVPLGGM